MLPSSILSTLSSTNPTKLPYAYIISNNDRGDECSMGGMGVPGGWEFPGDGSSSRGMGCSRGTSVLGVGCLGGWEFLIPIRNYSSWTL